MTSHRILAGARRATHPPASTRSPLEPRTMTSHALPLRGGALRRGARAGVALLALAGPGRFSLASAHEAAAHARGGPVRSFRDYAVPAVQLVRDDGTAVSLRDEVDDGRPVVLNFIYTTCTTICPMMSATFAQLEHRLGAQAAKVHLMSISIDPEQDTPRRLAEYARRFHAGPEWQHYTGTLAASVAAQRAFDVYRGGKMSHSLVTLMRAAPGKPWLRIEGWATPEDLERELRGLLAGRS